MRNMMKILFFICLALPVIIYACDGGGGTSGGGGGVTGTAVSAAGIMTKGSVDVNGITFDVDADTSIAVDDSLDQPESELQDGMFVLVKGTVNSDGTTGTADMVKSKDEVQGLVTAVNTSGTPQSFTVLGQTVYVDSATVYSGITGIADLVADTSYVEVHGMRNSMGGIDASRVELLTGSVESELKGIVSNKDQNGDGTFMLGDLIVETSPSTVYNPDTMTIADVVDGTYVDVHGSITAGRLSATEVEFEEVSDSAFMPEDGAGFEIEGIISGFTVHPGTFRVGVIEVQTTADTVFENGSSINLMDNVEVEVEGHVTAGALIVNTVQFEEVQLELEGTVTASDATSLTVFGLQVMINDITERPTDITAGTRYKINAVKDGTGTLTASSIEEASADDPDSIQAQVEAEGTGTLTILGITADLSATTKFKDDNDTLITSDAFFTAVAVDSIVRVQGTYDSGTNTITVEEAELES